VNQFDDELQKKQHISRFMHGGGTPDWLYTRIYCQKEEGDDILLHLVAPFEKFVREHELITGFFFVRFFEGGHHLRVRFRGEKSLLLGPLRNALNHHLNHYFMQRGFSLQHPLDQGPNGMEDRVWSPRLPKSTSRPVPSYEYDRYEPEIERYGGREGLEVSERHFSCSSSTALRVLDHEKKGAGPRKNGALLLIDALATAFHVTDQQKAIVFEQHFLYWMASSWCTPYHSTLFAQEYERHHASLQRLIPINSSLPEHRSRAVWTPIVEEWKEALNETYKALMLLESQKLLTVFHVELMSSYIHMLCNRLGLFPREEAYLVYLLSRHYAEHCQGTSPQVGPSAMQVS
jgi:thiopeptide-type bacteriocin biosynthesis protein